MSTELLAQMVELTSVKLAGQGLRKPIDVTRPGYLTGERAGSGGVDVARARRDVPSAATEGPDPSYGRAIGMLRSTAKPVAA